MANVFDLTAVIKLDDSPLKEGLGKAGKALKSFAKAGAVALGAAVTGVTAITKGAIDAYGEFEQLEGGIKKLYGNMGLHAAEYAEQQGKSISEVSHEWAQLEKAQQTVLENARNAYATAGMSMNTYMETATQFSASLINSLGGDSVEAARLTDVAMTAISDNWNTFGGDLDAISNAYKGFSKQNYTMLDNLKLGYGGTKTEMERLIADANEYAKSIGEVGDLSIDSFADIVTAIDLVQQKQNIAGTTAREASTTIQGSLNMTKAAWQNLLVAFGDKDADLGSYFDALLDSAETAFMNILPVAEQALSGIGNVIANLAPVIGDKFPQLINQVLPDIIAAAVGLVESLSNSLPAIISPLLDGIIAALPSLISASIKLFAGLAVGLIQAIPQIVAALPEIWAALKDGFSDAWPELEEAGVMLIMMVGEGISSAANWITAKAAEIWERIKDGITAAWDGIRAKTAAVWGKIKNSVSSSWDSIKSGVAQKVSDVRGSVVSGFDEIKAKASSIWDSIKSAISSKINSARDTVKSAINKIKGFLNFQWKLPHLKLPHIRLEKGEWPWGILGEGKKPEVHIDWYRKAYDTPYMFNKPTVMGFGDGVGDEMVYGKDSLMRDIKEAVRGTGEANVTINVYTQPNQDAAEIAREVQKEFIKWDRQRKAAYA